jgi:hypothetical protein
VCGARSTPTQSLDLKSVHTICQFNEPGRTREKLGSKISQNSKSKHVDTQPIDYSRELIDLFAFIELSFIANYVIDALTHGELIHDQPM